MILSLISGRVGNYTRSMSGYKREYEYRLSGLFKIARLSELWLFFHPAGAILGIGAAEEYIGVQGTVIKGFIGILVQ